MLEAVVLSFLCILERLEKRIYFFIFWKQKEINKKGEINYKIRIKGEEALTEDGERERERAREREGGVSEWEWKDNGATGDCSLSLVKCPSSIFI